MNDILITLQTAKLAKKKGFIGSCNGWYSYRKGNPLRDGHVIDYVGIETCFLAPTQSLLQRWLRDKHNINLSCYPIDNVSHEWYCEIDDLWLSSNLSESVITKYYNSYEDALEAGLQEALNLI